MAKSFKPLCSLFVLVLVICSDRGTEARPLKLGNSWSFSSIKSSSLFDTDELYIQAMKSASGGPSRGGVGHSYTTSQTLGGIKNGGPSSGGKGHAFTTSQTLGGIKNGGPSSEGN